MIKPVNNHLLIDPVKQEGFIASQSETYQEIGIVVDFDENINNIQLTFGSKVEVVKGIKVFFDSWLACKYPNPSGGFYWLVRWEDVRAVEYEK